VRNRADGSPAAALPLRNPAERPLAAVWMPLFWFTVRVPRRPGSELERRMHLTRRRLLLGAAAIPAVAAADHATRAIAGVIGTAVRAARPPADGTSATRCAFCGASDHAMLDPRCPAARRVV